MKFCPALTASKKLPTFSPMLCYKEFEYSVCFIGRKTVLLPSLHLAHYCKKPVDIIPTQNADLKTKAANVS